MTMLDPPIERVPETFRHEATHLVGRIRSGLMKAISESVGNVKRSRDVQERLGLNMTLSWQVYRILNNSENLIELCPHIPSAGMLQKLLSSARRKGASEAGLSALADAHAEFEKFVERYAGDRDCFDAMVAPIIGGDAQAQIELAHRRASFECQRHIRGLDIESHIASYTFGPPAQPGQHFGYMGLSLTHHIRRLSYDQDFTVSGRSFFHDSSNSKPLDADEFARRGGVPVLGQFCSPPTLPLRQKRLTDGFVETVWNGGEMGSPGAVDVALGEIYENFGLAKRPGNRFGQVAIVNVNAPVRVLVRDFVVHRPTFGSLDTEVTRWAYVAPRVPKTMDPPEEMGFPQLSCHDHVSLLGSGADAAYSTDVPRYVEMLQYGCGVMGWNLDEMDIYRIRIEYPLVNSVTAVSCTFPTSASWPESLTH
jgi:hypothetical protein